ncbi:hypothetical protein T458_20685 [Brevibacillus panacihumi W25]|uniref:Uncharacterized protein n=1 Tax=Brevibacillus panacihumi W25 TaxID=1408254 RepID=V6M5Q2_9BACL|nr:hypothetical protein T458_20685 [Brevibacillus panacihumi W25]
MKIIGSLARYWMGCRQSQRCPKRFIQIIQFYKTFPQIYTMVNGLF